MKLLAPAVVASALALAACAPASARETLVVAAPSSMLGVLPSLVEAFEALNPGTSVRFTTAGSATNVQQVINGAPIDVLITADEESMAAAVAAGAAGAPQPLATNTPVIAVTVGNPGSVQGIEDFSRSELVLVQCAPEQPCGRMADVLFKAFGVVPSIDSFEPSAAAALVKVATGEADATITYASVPVQRADLEVIEIAGAASARVTLMAARVLPTTANFSDARDPVQLFLEFLASSAAREILREAGFGLLDEDQTS